MIQSQRRHVWVEDEERGCEMDCLRMVKDGDQEIGPFPVLGTSEPFEV